MDSATMKATREKAVKRHQEELARMDKEEEILSLLPQNLPVTSIFAYKLFGKVAKVTVEVDDRRQVQEIWDILPGIPIAMYKGGGVFFTYEFWDQEREDKRQTYEVTPAGNFFWEYQDWEHTHVPNIHVEWCAELENKEVVEVCVVIKNDPAKATVEHNRYSHSYNGYSYHQHDFPPGQRIEFMRVSPKDPGHFVVYQPYGCLGPENILCPQDLFGALAP